MVLKVLVSLLSVGEGRRRDSKEEMQEKEERSGGERGMKGRGGERKDCRLDFPEKLLLFPRFWKV